MAVAVSSRWRNRGIGSALLGELELRLRTLGVRRISALLPADATGTTALRNSGYDERAGLRSSTTSAPRMRDCWPSLGGQVMRRGLWYAMAGMESGRHRQVVDLVWWLRGLVVVAMAARYQGYRYPIEVIGYAVWLYHRFGVS